MLFNSFEFPVFFIACFVAYWSLRSRLRAQNLLIVAASYFFYGWWDVRFLCLITISTAIDYCTAHAIANRSLTPKQRITATAFTIATSTGFLAFDWSASTTNPGILPSPTGENLTLILAIYAFAALANIVYPLFYNLPVQKRRKAFAFVSIAANLGILAVFKYFNFFADSLSDISMTMFGSPLSWTTIHIILPVGISFYTFQTMSYTIDVYRGKLKPCESFIELAAYVSFFPQLVAGPIERASHLLPQFRKLRVFNKEQAKEALWLILWGFYKKLVVADNLAPMVNATFALSEGGGEPPSGMRLVIAIYAFAFQIYCDFSGYTDIARGTAKLLGFELMLNFNLPYISRSPSEFWQRWHISLSSWLRDYLYIPLGGNRGGNFATYRNLMITMTLGGLWHGASWNFVAWGIYQGAILSIYRWLAPELGKTRHGYTTTFAQWFLMFQLTCFGWLLFRVSNLSSVPEMLSTIFTDFSADSSGFSDLSTLLFYIWPLVAIQALQAIKGDLLAPLKLPPFQKFNLILFVLLSLFVLSSKGGSDFIYFAF